MMYVAFMCGLQAAAAALAEAVAEGEAAAAERASLAQQLAAAEAGVAGVRSPHDTSKSIAWPMSLCDVMRVIV